MEFYLYYKEDGINRLGYQFCKPIRGPGWDTPELLAVSH